MQYFFKTGLVALVFAAVTSCGGKEGMSTGSYILVPPAVPDSDLILQVSAAQAEMEKVDFKESPLRKNLVHIGVPGTYSVSLSFYVAVFAAYVSCGQGLCALSPSICVYSTSDSLVKTIHEVGSLSANTSLALQDKSNEKTEKKLVALSDTINVPENGAYVSIAIKGNVMLAHGGTSYCSGLGYACAYIQQNADEKKITLKKLP
ncbi:MAG: hypothetical protein LBF67_00095 [Prevotellaceae bacterium]|jgi:hypothetical protein|nr:hypothetical protein [Prevotellaceae bacterium]